MSDKQVDYQTGTFLKPSVGRIVHYCEKENKDPLAAIVVKVWDDKKVNLTVFGEDGTAIRGSEVPFSQSLTPGNWSWPARV